MKYQLFIPIGIVMICCNVPQGNADVCVSAKIKQLDACGVVVDAYRGQPIQGAKISVANIEGEKSIAITDSNGKFALAGFHGTHVEIHAQASGFEGADSIPVDRVKMAGTRCREPIFVVLGIRNICDSFITARKSDLPKVKNK